MHSVFDSPRDYWKTVWIPALFAVLAAAFAILPQEIVPLKRADLLAAGRINSLIGLHPAWDGLLAVLNHPKYGQPLGCAVIFAIYLACAWRQRFHDMGRLLGYLGWMSCGVLVALGIAYVLTHRAEGELDIRGPSYGLANFRDLNRYFDGWRIYIADKNSVPSREASIYFTVLWMAFFRSKGLAAILLLPTLLFSFSATGVGREWPSSMLASFFLGGTVAGILTRTPLVGAPRWLDRFSLRWVERLLTFWTPSRPHSLGGFGWPGDADPDDEWGELEVISHRGLAGKDQTLDDIIRDKVAPLLGLAGGDKVEILETPPGGNSRRRSRYVRYLVGERLTPPIVVKGAWKRLASFRRADRVAKYRNAADVHLLLQTSGAAPAPRFLFHLNGSYGMPRVEFHLNAEEFVEGRSLKAGSAEDLRLAAEALAKMHSIERKDAGGVTIGVIPRRRFPHRAIFPRIRRYAWTVSREMPASEIAFFGARTLEWFWRRAVEILDSGTPFALCHNDVAVSNVIINDKGAFLLDFTVSAFGLPGLDLAEALLDWHGGSREAAHSLLESYFVHSSPARWTAFQQGFDFYISLTALESLFHYFDSDGAKHSSMEPRQLADVAARALKGGLPSPASPAESADLFCDLFLIQPGKVDAPAASHV